MNTVSGLLYEAMTSTQFCGSPGTSNASKIRAAVVAMPGECAAPASYIKSIFVVP